MIPHSDRADLNVQNLTKKTWFLTNRLKSDSKKYQKRYQNNSQLILLIFTKHLITCRSLSSTSEVVFQVDSKSAKMWVLSLLTHSYVTHAYSENIPELEGDPSKTTFFPLGFRSITKSSCCSVFKTISNLQTILFYGCFF